MKKDSNNEAELSKSSFLNEPAVAYLTSGNFPSSKATSEDPVVAGYNVKRSIALLGLSFTKPFNEAENFLDFIECIREGVPKKALDNFIQITGFSPLEISKIVHTSDRTLRRYTPKQKLDPEQSERVIELAKLYTRGEQVFGSLESFNSWMNSEVVALGDKKPKSYLDTSLGIEMLMDELGKIEHGIFA